MVLRIAILLVFIGQLFVVKAQYDQFLGNFPIYNFTNDDFNSPVQIWTGCQTENGILLFGNDEKIIRFNGRDWTFIQPSVKDGMDLGLASVDIEQMQLEFAGANNSCVIIRNGELIEIKGDKQPIGDFELAKPFTNHTFQLEKGDNIYLFTDGYVDQFGGENEASRQNGGKKFKSKPFKQFLLSISHHDMKTQEKLIVEKFDNWRGEIEAIDDVCVFGIKI